MFALFNAVQTWLSCASDAYTSRRKTGRQAATQHWWFEHVCVAARWPSWRVNKITQLQTTSRRPSERTPHLARASDLASLSHEDPSYLPRRRVESQPGVSQTCPCFSGIFATKILQAHVFLFPYTGMAHRTQDMIRISQHNRRRSTNRKQVRGGAASHALWARTAFPRRGGIEQFRGPTTLHVSK